MLLAGCQASASFSRLSIKEIIWIHLGLLSFQPSNMILVLQEGFRDIKVDPQCRSSEPDLKHRVATRGSLQRDLYRLCRPFGSQSLYRLYI